MVTTFKYTNWYFILPPGPRVLALHISKCRYRNVWASCNLTFESPEMLKKQNVPHGATLFLKP